MIVLLIIVLVLVLLALLASVFLLGFRLGGEQWQSELARGRLEAAQAERRLHNLTRQAFVSMAEAVEQRRRDR
jgi:flagellar basal body-associated protein FliL